MEHDIAPVQHVVLCLHGLDAVAGRSVRLLLLGWHREKLPGGSERVIERRLRYVVVHDLHRQNRLTLSPTEALPD